MKGQNPLISHTLIVAMSVLVLFLVVTTFNNIEKNQIMFVARSEADSICSTLSSQILKIYRNETYNSPGGQTCSWENIYLEKRLMIYNYKIYFNNSDIIISFKNTKINCSVPINATLIGSSYGGEVKLTWEKLSDGQDEIILSNAG